MKTVYILIGPKGSGKSYICSLLAQEFTIHFIRVETLFLKIKTNKPIDDEIYLKSGYNLVENEIKECLKINDSVIIESTGIAKQFNEMVKRLKNEYLVKLIKIEADPQLSLQRIKNRDQSIHIPVSDNDIQFINEKSRLVNLNFDHIVNNNFTSDNELVQIFKRIIN